MLKTPPGVSWPFDPVLTVERPMRMPLRYTCIVCCGTLTSTIKGPLGDSSGFHQYSPGFSRPLDLPVGMPLVCAAGLSIAWDAAVRSATKIVSMTGAFMKRDQRQLQHQLRRA